MLRGRGWSWVMLALLLIGFGAEAEPKPGSPGAPVPLLWRVDAGGGSLYLLGSFHLLRADDYPLADEVNQAYAGAQRLAFELPAEDVDSPALATTMLQAAQRAPGTSLREDLDAATWERLQAYCVRHGLPLQALQGYRPWFVGLSIGISEMARQGMDPALGLDRHFMQKALADGKPVQGLERASEQIALLAGMSDEEQRQMLAESLDDASGDGAQARQLHDAWRRGAAESLWQDMGQQMRQRYPALYRSINVERNQRWLPQLERLLKQAPADGDVLVVVGALHLLGPDGLVAQLRARGYQVERICSSCAGKP